MQALGFQISIPTVPAYQYTLNKRQLDENALRRLLSTANSQSNNNIVSLHTPSHHYQHRYRGNSQTDNENAFPNPSLASDLNTNNPFFPPENIPAGIQSIVHSLSTSRRFSYIFPTILSLIGILHFILLFTILPTSQASTSIPGINIDPSTLNCTLYGGNIQCNSVKGLFATLVGFVSLFLLTLSVSSFFSLEPIYSVLSWYYPYIGIGNAYKGQHSPLSRLTIQQSSTATTVSSNQQSSQPRTQPLPILSTQLSPQSYYWTKPAWNSPTFVFSLILNMALFVILFAGFTIQLLFILLFTVSGLTCTQGCVNSGVIIASSIVSLILYVYAIYNILILGILSITFDSSIPRLLNIIPALIYSRKHAHVQFVHNNINIYPSLTPPLPLPLRAPIQPTLDQRHTFHDEASITISSQLNQTRPHSTDEAVSLNSLISTLPLEAQENFFCLQECHEKIQTIAQDACYVDIPAGSFFVFDSRYPEMPIIPIAMIIEAESKPPMLTPHHSPQNQNSTLPTPTSIPAPTNTQDASPFTSAPTPSADLVNTPNLPNPQPNDTNVPLGSPSHDVPRGFGNTDLQAGAQPTPYHSSTPQTDLAHPFSPLSSFTTLPSIPNNSHVSNPPILSPNGTNLISPGPWSGSESISLPSTSTPSLLSSLQSTSPLLPHELSHPELLSPPTPQEQATQSPTTSKATQTPNNLPSLPPPRPTAVTNTLNQNGLPSGAPFKLQKRIATYRWLYLHLSTPPLRYIPPAVPLHRQSTLQYTSSLAPDSTAPPHMEITKPQSMIWFYRIKRYVPYVNRVEAVLENNGLIPESPSYTSPSSRSFSHGVLTHNNPPDHGGNSQNNNSLYGTNHNTSHQQQHDIPISSSVTPSFTTPSLHSNTLLNHRTAALRHNQSDNNVTPSTNTSISISSSTLLPSLPQPSISALNSNPNPNTQQPIPPSSSTNRSRRMHKLTPVTPSSNKIMSHSPNSTLCGDDEEEVCVICQLALWPDQYENLREHWIEVPNQPQKIVRLKKQIPSLKGDDDDGDDGDDYFVARLNNADSNPNHIQTIDEGDGCHHVSTQQQLTTTKTTTTTPTTTTTTTTANSFVPLVSQLLSPPNNQHLFQHTPYNNLSQNNALPLIATSELPHPFTNTKTSQTHNPDQSSSTSILNTAMNPNVSSFATTNSTRMHKTEYEEVLEIPDIGFGEVVSLCPANGHAKMHSSCCEQWLWHCAVAQTHVKCGICRLSIPLSVDVVSSVSKSLSKIHDIRHIIQYNGINIQVHFPK